MGDVGRPNKNRDEVSRGVATTFLFRGSQGKKNKFSEEKRAGSGWKTTTERETKSICGKVGASPAEVRKASGVVRRLVKGCGRPNMASGSKPNGPGGYGSPRKMAEAKSGVGRVSGKARTLRKRGLSSEETKRPVEDKAWVCESGGRVSELNQMVFGLSAAKSDLGGSQSSDPGSWFVRG